MNNITLEQINGCTMDELHMVNQQIIQRMNYLRAQVAYSFSYGDRVSFPGNRRYGNATIFGTVIKINNKNIKVKSDQGQTWTVTSTLLTKLPKPVAPLAITPSNG